MIDYRYVRLPPRPCSQCGQMHVVAIQTYRCGRLDYGCSPWSDRCYACQLAAIAGTVEREVTRARWRRIWRAAGGGDPPAELK